MNELFETVLIVDDTPNNIKLAASVLKAESIDVAFANSGSAALDWLRENRPSLILLDVMMPGMDGFEVCRRIKSDPLLREIPIIFLTAKTDVDSLANGFAQGGADYIPKPFTPKELVSRVKSHLDLYSARRELLLATETLQKKSALLQKAVETRDMFFGIVAHDLRGPLSVSVGMLEMLTYGKEAPGATPDDEMLFLAREQCERSMNLLNELLCWAMGQTSDVETRKSEFDLGEEIQKCISLFAFLASRKEVGIHFSNSYSGKVIADKNMMSTVVRNLLSNAIKFSKKGTSIRVTLEDTEQSIVCTVSDSGVGIPLEKLSSIFELGIKKSSEGTSGEAGNGLGLFLCRSFVEKNGGVISVTSEPGAGTSVKFTIPRP